MTACCGYMLGMRDWILVFRIGEITDNMYRKLVSRFVNMLVLWLASVEIKRLVGKGQVGLGVGPV